MAARLPGTIVTGNVAASRQLRRDFDLARTAEGKLVWDSPDILPRDAWMRRTYQESIWQECARGDPGNAPVLLTRWQELTLWEEAIEAATRDVLLNSHATASAAREAWRLLYVWEASPDSFAFDESEDTAAFFQWMGQVRRRLLDRGWITMAELPGALHKRLAAGEADGYGQITLAGFDEIATADRRLFEALGAGQAAGLSCTPQATLAVCHDVADELTKAAVWARQKLEAQPLARVGVVVPGLAPVATIAERIFDDILRPAWGFSGGERAFFISGGDSLAGAPMISAALVTLRLIEGVPREEAAMLWRSPFVGLEPAEGARIDVELRRQGAEHASLRLDSVKRRFSEMAVVAATLPARSRPSQWSAAFSRLLRLASWPGKRTLTPVEHQTLESWKDLLSELARLDAVTEAISCGGAISRLERMAGGGGFAPEGENAPVQILDISKAAGSHFDALWIAGMHAGAWPRRPQPSPFLPLAMQRAAGMPRSSAEREVTYARRVTERLLASALEVVCSFPSHAADEEQRASPLLAALPLLPEPPRADTVARRVFSHAPQLEPRPADEGVPLPAETLQRGGTQVLADQSACPFRAFAVHRLRAREMDEPDVGLSAMDRGSVVHKALELLWNELQTQAGLIALKSEELGALIRSCVDSALGQYASRREPSRALDQFRKLEQARLEGLLGKWMEVERGRRQFTVIASENARTVPISGLNLDIRVDRIDRYEDGTHAIIDYKTSAELFTDMWMGERPEAPQLPVYATTTDLPLSEVAFAQIATGSVKWESLQGNVLAQQLPQWEAVVRRLAEDFLNGRAEVDPRAAPYACAFCKLAALCRVNELKKQPAGEDRDE